MSEDMGVQLHLVVYRTHTGFLSHQISCIHPATHHLSNILDPFIPEDFPTTFTLDLLLHHPQNPRPSDLRSEILASQAV